MFLTLESSKQVIGWVDRAKDDRALWPKSKSQ